MATPCWVVPYKDPAKRRRAMKKWRESKVAAGLCTRCGNNAPRPGILTCDECIGYVSGRSAA